MLLGAPMIAVPLGIIFLSFISEDAATVSSALLLFGGPIAWPLGFVSCFLGIWVGDLGLYSIARWLGKPLLRAPWLARFADPGVVARAEESFAQRGTTALLVSRFVPGTRLPTYLAAGLTEMSAARFALVTAVGALVWIGGVFGLTRLLGAQTLVWFSFVESKAARLAFAAFILVAGGNRPEKGDRSFGSILQALDALGILAGLALLSPGGCLLRLARVSLSQFQSAGFRQSGNTDGRSHRRIEMRDYRCVAPCKRKRPRRRRLPSRGHDHDRPPALASPDSVARRTSVCLSSSSRISASAEMA